MGDIKKIKKPMRKPQVLKKSLKALPPKITKNRKKAMPFYLTPHISKK